MEDLSLDSIYDQIPDNMYGTTAAREVWESSCLKEGCEWVSERHDVRLDSIVDLAAHTHEAHPMT